MKRFSFAKKIGGLTFVELLTVMAIIAAVAGAGMISLTMLDDKKLEGDARRIVASLCWAREMASNTRQDYIVDFDIATSSYRVYRGSVAAANELSRQGLQTTLASVAPASQVTFSFPRGTTTDTTITLTLNAKTAQVLVFGETGYVRIQ